MALYSIFSSIWLSYCYLFFDHLSVFEAIVLMLVQGMISGAVGITFAHELMHQKTKFERFLSIY